MQLNVGETYARKYRIARVLGEGAMGAVYEAENVLIRRRVAIKVLHAHIAQKADTLKRFEREAQAAGRIGSAHIVEVLDMGELADSDRFMVMEFLEGTTLDKRIRSRGRLTPEEATPIITQILEGLAAAHKAEIIHRDLKPANVFLMSKGQADFVKILDFGVSKFNVLNDEMSMTSTGAVLGTPYYMSPEQAKGSRKVDPRSDLYAVGVILYECITGQVPFSAETFNELLFRIVLESPPPVESFVPNLDPGFTAIIHRAMAREPGERYQTAVEFQDALKRWIAQLGAGPMIPPRPPPGLVGPVLTSKGTLMLEQHPSILDSSDTDTAPTRRNPPAWMPLPPPFVPTMPDQFPFEPTPVGPAVTSHGASGPPSTPALLSLQDTYVVPKRPGGLMAFVVGLIGMLLLGAGTVAAMKWHATREAAAAAAARASAAAAAEAPAPPPPPPPPEPPSAPEPSELPAASTTLPVGPPVAVAPRSQPARGTPPAARVAAPKAPAAPPKATAAPTTTATPGKRTISSEL